MRLEGTEDGAVTVTLNRADRKNAFNAELIGALRETFETLRDQETVRVVFLRGEGGTFSAGADLEWMRDAADHLEADNRDDAMQMAIMLKHLYDIPALTVALVEGGAFGGGVGLAAACDMAIAVEGARFAFSEVKLGLGPRPSAPTSSRRSVRGRRGGCSPPARCSTPHWRARIGLLDEVVPDVAALEASKDRIRLAMQACAPGAVGESKKLVAHLIGRHLDHALMDHTARLIAAVRVGAEGQAGVRAFLAGAKPPWADV